MRIVVVEDSVLLREGLVRLFEEFGHEVVAVLGDPEALPATVAVDRPDLVVADVRMPPTFTDEGLRAAVALRHRHPGLPVLVLSQWVEERYATELIEQDPAGVGYLLKDRVADVAEFMAAAERVAAGGTALDAEVVGQLFARRRPGALDALTRREREVLALMAQGRSNTGIARALSISAGAVEKHITSIFQRLDLGADGAEHRRVLAVLAYLDSA